MTRTEQTIREMLEELEGKMTDEQTARAHELLAVVKASDQSPAFKQGDRQELERAEFGSLAGLIDMVCLREDSVGRPLSDDAWQRYSVLAAAALEKRGISMPADFFE